MTTAIFLILSIGLFVGFLNWLPNITEYPTFIFENINYIILKAFQLNWVIPIQELFISMKIMLQVVLWSLIFLGLWKIIKMVRGNNS